MQARWRHLAAWRLLVCAGGALSDDDGRSTSWRRGLGTIGGCEAREPGGRASEALYLREIMTAPAKHVFVANSGPLVTATIPYPRQNYASLDE